MGTSTLRRTTSTTTARGMGSKGRSVIRVTREGTRKIITSSSTMTTSGISITSTMVMNRITTRSTHRILIKISTTSQGISETPWIREMLGEDTRLILSQGKLR